MKHLLTKVLALCMALCIGLGCVSFAHAADPVAAVVPDIDPNGVFSEGTGADKGTVELKFNVTANRSCGFAYIALKPDGLFSSAEITAPALPLALNAAVPTSVTVKATFNTAASAGNHAGKDELNFVFTEGGTAESVTVSAPYNVKKTTAAVVPTPAPSPTPTPSPDTAAKVRLSGVDKNGVAVPAPSGNYGETILLRVPILCQYDAISSIKVCPVVSTDVEKYPFDIARTDYTLTYGSMTPGEIVEFQYSLTMSKKATVGVKQVDFKVSYRNSQGNIEETTLNLFVNVKKGLAASTSTDSTGSIPKLIVESYTISSDKIYAGETFEVTFVLRNTSSNETIQNLQIHVSDTAEVSKIVPASGGSNTLYVSRIGKNESHTEKLSLQTAPDTEAKAYTLALECSYQGSSTNTEYKATETIAIPILQKIRIKCDDPVINDEAYVDQSCSLYVAVYNMGKSSLYNCMVDVEGEGLKMEETYFGGNVGAGSTLQADFSILPSVAGEIEGNVLILYEDVYGEQSVEKLPFTLTVNEAFDPMAGMEGMEGMEGMMGEEEPVKGGFPWWIPITAVALLGGAGAFILLKKRKQKRQKELMDA